MPGFLSRSQRAIGVFLSDDDGNVVGSQALPLQSTTTTSSLPAGTDRSGTVGTTAVVAMAQNTGRRGGIIQNISTGTIGVNETGGTAVIGGPGTYTLPANGSMSIRTNRAISVVGSAAGLAYTALEF